MDILKSVLLSAFLACVLISPMNVMAKQTYKDTLLGKAIENSLKIKRPLNTPQNRVVPSDGNNSANVSDLEIDARASKAFANNLLSQAVDNLDFEFIGADGPGFFNQDAIYNVDCDAAQSERIFDSQTSIMLTGVNGPTDVSFDWRVSSERNFDGLAFLILGVDQNGQVFETGISDGIDGEVNWNTRSFRVPSGPHLLVWGYVKDASVSTGADTGWVDQVLIGPIGQVSPDLDNAEDCSTGTATIPVIINFLLNDDGADTPTPPPT